MPNPTISMIVAMAEDRAIGINNDMLWHLPDDFKHFKRTTSGHPVIMGRKTFESLGGALPNRLNIIVTSKADYQPKNAEVVDSLEKAIARAKQADREEIFIAGGGEIYRQALAESDKLYLTIVHAKFPEADTYFPEINWDEWEEVKRINHEPDEKHAHAFTFLFLERK